MKYRVLIIGASSDLGFPIAEKLYKQGHSLFLHYHSQSKKLETLASKNVFLSKADLRKENEAQLLFENAKHKLDGIDILINMIGPYFEKDILSMNPEEWKSMIDLNLNTIFTSCYFAIPEIQKNKGHILNFCFDGVENLRSWKNATAYAAAKTGLAVLSKSLATALAPHGARVNVICPGYVDSETFSPEKREAIIQKIPQGRMANTEEIVSLVSWLIEESPSYINGALIPIGGAWEHQA